MMIFNPKQCDFLIKNGANVMGAGTHYVTSKFYIFFKKDEMLDNAMTSWSKLCKLSRCK